jgi:hypothetical protein
MTLGTVDREYLEKEWMIPERIFNIESAIPWAKRIPASCEGVKVDGHEAHPAE